MTQYRIEEFIRHLSNNSDTILGVLRQEQKNYYKGWNTDIGLLPETLGVEQSLAEDIVLPLFQTPIQISSSNPADVGLPILVTGYDGNFNQISDVLVTNGNTPSSGLQQFFRITGLRNLSSLSSNIGTIYISPDPATVVGGIPSPGDYLYSMKPGENVGAILNGVIAPTENGYLLPNYVAFSIANDSGTRSTVSFQIKNTDSFIWSTEFEFYIDERSNTQFTWRLDGIPPIPNNDINTPVGKDIRIQISRNGGGNLWAAGSISISQNSI